jgi:peptidoglycan/LPS O-acetylase OafA/YrhL
MWRVDGAQPNVRRESYFPYIDGLRALSIIAVVLFHLDPRLLPGGFGGVDIFFVVSGFIISGSLHDRRFSGFLDLLATFYSRRFRRIVPALLFMLIITSILFSLFVPPGFFISGGVKRTASAAFFGLSNFPLAFAQDYFFPLAEFNPFTHTWSLAVEEQFYVAFPVIYLFLTMRRTANFALVILLALCVASFAYGFFEARTAFNLGFYSSPSRFWEIGSGVLLYALFARLNLYQPKHSNEITLASYAGMILILSGFVFGAPKSYPVPGALLPAFGALCLIIALHGRKPTSIVGKALTFGPVVWIGLISYSLYLWHWPIFSLFRWTLGFGDVWQKALALLLAIAMTLVSYWYVELPIRYSVRLKNPRRVIPAFLTAIVFLYWGNERLLANARHVSMSVVTSNSEDWYGPREREARAGECRVEVRETQMKGGPPLHDLTPIDCGYSGMHRLFVIGDSHAGAYYPMLHEYARRTGTPVALYADPCGFPRSVLPRSGCAELEENVISAVKQRAKPGDVLFLPSLRVPRFREQWMVHDHDTAAAWRVADADLAARLAEAASTLQGMAGPGLRFVFELPKPIFRIPLFRCSDWFNRHNPACDGGSTMDRAFLLQYRQPVLSFAEELRARVDDFSTWDPFPLLCPEAVCSMWMNGRPLFYDGDHPTYFANTLLVDDFIAKINAASLKEPPRAAARRE